MFGGMKMRHIVIAVLFIACSKSPQQEALDTYFGKEEGYKPIGFEPIDTLTIEEYRLSEVEDLQISERSSMLSDKERSAIEVRIDSLKNRMGGFDAQTPHQITGHYKFKSGLDTFTYFIKFNEKWNIIQATKKQLSY